MPTICPFYRTNWVLNSQRYKSMTVVYVLVFYTTVQDMMFLHGLWPFLVQVDSSVSEEFYSYTVTVKNLAIALSAPLYGWWMNRRRDLRTPVHLSLGFYVLSNVTYFLAEHAVKYEKWMILASRVLSGISAGSNGILYAYLSMASTMKERNTVFSIRGVIATIGWVVGPLVSATFYPLGYPGLFNLYTAPAAACLFLEPALFFSVHRWVSNAYIGSNANDNRSSVGVNWIAAISSITMVFFLGFTYTFMVTAMGPVSMLTLKLTEKDTLLLNSIIQIVSSFLGIGFFIFVAVYCLGRMKERSIILMSLFFPLIAFMMTYPYPTAPLLLDVPSSVNVTRPCLYAWCDSGRTIPMAAYVIGVTAGSTSYEIITNTVTILFSKVLGTARQGTLQGTFVAAVNLGRTVAPLTFGYTFEIFGLEGAWILPLTLSVLNILIWVGTYGSLLPNEPDEITQPLLLESECAATPKPFSEITL